MKVFICFFSLLIIVSCTEPYPESIRADFYYYNNSGIDIKIVSQGDFADTITIPNSEFYSTTMNGRGVIVPFNGDSLELIFNSSRRVKYKWSDNSSTNPLKLENYVETRINDNYYEYKYFITEQDYLNATR